MKNRSLRTSFCSLSTLPLLAALALAAGCFAGDDSNEVGRRGAAINGAIDAFTPFAAGRYDAMSGVQPTEEFDASVVGYLDNGDWLLYRGVDFGAGASAFTARVAVPAEYAGQTLELHLDSRTGPLVGQLTIQSTGAWDALANQTANVSGASGVHDLYVVVRGKGSAGNLASLVFTRAASATPPPTGGRNALAKIEAESFDAQKGTQAAGAGIVGYMDNGDWLLYRGVDFGAGVTSFTATIGVPDAYAGQSLELRLDSATGALVGTLKVSSTGSWQTLRAQTTSVNGASGKHDLYVVVKGAYGAGNLDAFTFAASGTPTPAPTPAPTTTTPPPPPPPPPSTPPTSTAPGNRITSLTARGAFDAAAGTTYSGLRVTNPNGPCITVNGKTNVRIVDSEIGPCGGSAAIVVNGGASAITIEHVTVHDSARGVLVDRSSASTLASRFYDINGAFPSGTAIEYDFVPSGVIDGNLATGSYGSDVISGFESSNLRITNNVIEANMTEPSAAGFTIGDSVAGTPGHDNYVAYNKVFTTGGVPPGVFGSSGNTILELNCLRTGIQAYQYNGPFVGVTVRNNRIGPGSFVPDTSVISGWSTNTFTNGSAATCDGL